MQVAQGVPRRALGLRALTWLVASSLVALAALLGVLFAHSATSSEALLGLAEFLAIALVALASASLVLAVVYSWRAYPQHRRPIAFVVAITVATLLAHVYIIGSPAASTGEVVSGAVGATFHDDHVTIDSSVTGQTMILTVQVTGGDAVADIVPEAGGEPLSGPGFNFPPSLSSPLQPSGSASGTWTLPASGAATNISVAYDRLTCYSTNSRSYGCIMDEVFYVPEAMGILAGQHCATGGPDCHMEHPPLVPALMAAGMAVFGQYDAAGWRVMPALLGTFSIPVVFGIAWRVSGEKRVAYSSALFLSLDVMFFSQSSGGLLDVPETFLGLLALLVYVANVRVWKFDRYVFAGVFLGLAALAKETAIFMALALGTYILFFGDGGRLGRAKDVLKVAAVVVLVFAGGLQAYDSTLAAPSVPTFVQHVSYMLSYGSSLVANSLACQPTTGYWCKFANDPGGAPILPSDWLLYYSPVAYYATSVTVCPNTVNGVCQGGEYSYVALAYYGVTNLLETWTVFVWVPIAAYVLYRRYRKPQPSLDEFGFESGASLAPGPSSEVKFAGLALVWFACNYLPYIALFFYGRVTYPFYFVPAIPAMAMGAAYWVTRSWFPRKILYLYLVMVLVFFIIYFPSKAFLPDWLRVLIGH